MTSAEPLDALLTRVRAKTIEEFGALVHHSGEEYIHVLEGRMEVHTEFYDPIVLETGQSVYIDSNMGHAYIAAEGCDEVLLLGVCSSSDEQLMESLMTLHGEESLAQQQPLSLMVLDLDHFAAINQAYGHAEGDAVLQALSHLLLLNLRRQDLLCRLGDELKAGQPMYRVHAAFPSDQAFARAACEQASGLEVGLACDVPPQTMES